MSPNSSDGPTSAARLEAAVHLKQLVGTNTGDKLSQVVLFMVLQ